MTGILLHTMATPEYDLTSAVTLAADLGFDGLEVIYQSGYRCGLRLDVSDAEARRFGERAARAGVPVKVLSAYEKRLSRNEATVTVKAKAALSRAIDVASEVGARALRVLAAEEVGDADWHGAAMRFRDAILPLADKAEAGGVMLLIENHMDTLATSAERTVALCKAAAHPNLRILFDPANLALMGSDGFLEGFDRQRGLIAHVHVKDAVVLDGVRRSVVPGEGNDPWMKLIEKLLASGYAGDLSLEYERRWLPELPAAEDALPRAKAFVERCLAAARLETKD